MTDEQVAGLHAKIDGLSETVDARFRGLSETIEIRFRDAASQARQESDAISGAIGEVRKAAVVADDRVRREMAEGFAAVRGEMAGGFAGMERGFARLEGKLDRVLATRPTRTRSRRRR